MEKIGFIVVAFIIFDLFVALFYYITFIRDAKTKQLKAYQDAKNEEEEDFETMMQKIIEEDRRMKEEEKAQSENTNVETVEIEENA